MKYRHGNGKVNEVQRERMLSDVDLILTIAKSTREIIESGDYDEELLGYLTDTAKVAHDFYRLHLYSMEYYRGKSDEPSEQLDNMLPGNLRGRR
jgi:hypothetical protein